MIISSRKAGSRKFQHSRKSVGKNYKPMSRLMRLKLLRNRPTPSPDFSGGSEMHSVTYFHSQNYTAETKYLYVKFTENSEYGKSRTDSAQLETTSQFSQVD